MIFLGDRQNNLLVDPLQHTPGIYNALAHLGNVSYFSDIYRIGRFEYLWGYYQKNEFFKEYGFPSQCITEDFELLRGRTFSNLFLTFPLPECRFGRTEEVISYYRELYQRLRNNCRIENKIIFIDNHDYCHDMSGLVKEKDFKCDVIFKKEFSNKVIYGNNYKPFPFVVLGKRDALTILNGNRAIKIKRNNKCFWSGSATKEKDRERCVDFDREFWVKELFPHLISIESAGMGNFGSADYLECMGECFFALYLKGAATLTRRLFEILAVDSLMMMEALDINFGLTHQIDSRCIFRSPEEFQRNFTELSTNTYSYKEALAIQFQFKKQFEYDSIATYILKHL